MEKVLLFSFIGGIIGSFLGTTYAVYLTIKGAEKEIKNKLWNNGKTK